LVFIIYLRETKTEIFFKNIKKTLKMNIEQQLRDEIKNLKNEIKELENKPLSITGEVIFVTPTKDVSKKDKPFLVRGLCLDTTINVNGTPYKNNASFQFAGDDKCKLLDNINIGDKLEVFFSIKGTTYTIQEKDRKEGDNVKNPDWLGCMTNLQAYKVNVLRKNESSSNSSNTTSNTGNPTPEVKDDLPF
jgi:hypothetical protein